MCQILRVSKSGFYRWQSKVKTKRAQENKDLLIKIREIYLRSNRIYGSPRVLAVLRCENLSFSVNHKRVERLMKINGIVAKTKRKFKASKNAKHNYPVAPNLIKQDFSAPAPNKLYLSDISYIKTKEGWLYLAAVLDAYTRKIVGWSMSKRQSKELVENALLHAVKRQKVDGEIILHSDQGKQYASYSYRDLCKEYGFIQSMSGRGNCYDNAMMESFFHTLKTEEVYWQNYETRAEAKKSIFEYIEINYNRIRLHSGIGYKTPVEFEMLAKRLQN